MRKFKRYGQTIIDLSQVVAINKHWTSDDRPNGDDVILRGGGVAWVPALYSPDFRADFEAYVQSLGAVIA